MELSKLVVFMMFIMVASFGYSMSAEITLNWTAGTNYQQWACTHNFVVGDKIVFHYNPQNHNVYQVKKEDFEVCSTATPIALYTSGWDAITFTKPGSYYFFCGYPGHYSQRNQKVIINVQQCYGVVTSPPGYPSNTSSSSTPTYTGDVWMAAVTAILTASFLSRLSL